MRPVGLSFVGFMYLLSFGFLLAEVVVLAPAGYESQNLSGVTVAYNDFVQENTGDLDEFRDDALNPRNEDNSIIDRVLQFTQSSFVVVWHLISLLTGTYMFNFMTLLGIPGVFIGVIQMIFSLVVVSTVVSLVVNRS